MFFFILGSLLSVTCRHRSVQLWDNTLTRYRWIPRAESLELCWVRSFLFMTDELATIKLGLTTGAGSSHGQLVHAPIRSVILHSVYDSVGRLATGTASIKTKKIKKLMNEHNQYIMSILIIINTNMQPDCPETVFPVPSHHLSIRVESNTMSTLYDSAMLCSNFRRLIVAANDRASPKYRCKL